MSIALTGPWRLFCQWHDFGPEAYFVNIPSKFMSADGQTVWVCYSANHSNKNGPCDPAGSRYALSLYEAELLKDDG